MGMLNIARRVVQAFGLDVTRYRPTTLQGYRRQLLLASRGVDRVLDVGANAGQYALELRRFGYCGSIVSVEPLPDAFQALKAHAARDPRWDAVQIAVGARDSSATIHVAANSVSSSLLPMLPTHADIAPESRYTGTQTVAVTTVDAIAAAYRRDAVRTFLKADTQGFEGAVLDGAVGTLPTLVGLEVEMSLVPLYDGAPLFGELHERILALGFTPYGIEPEFIDPVTGRTLQINAVYVRD